MTIGKKILATVSYILIISTLLFVMIFLVVFSNLKIQSEKSNNILKELILERTHNTYTSFSERTLYEYTKLFTKEKNDRFYYIQDTVIDLSDLACDLYHSNIKYNVQTNFTLLPGVAYEDIEDELQLIYPFQKFLGYHNSSFFDESKIYYCSESGFLLNSPLPSTNKTIEYDLHSRQWYQSTKTSNTAVWSEPYEDLSSGDMIVTCSNRVYGDNGEFMGAVAVDFDGYSLMGNNPPNTETDQKIKNEYFSKYFIMDQSGKLILLSPGLSLADYLTEDNYNEIMKTCLHPTEEINITIFDTVIVSSAGLSINGWRICFILDSSFVSENINYMNTAIENFYDTIDQNFKESALDYILPITFTFLIMIVGAFFLSRKLTKSITIPLDELSAGIKEIGAGNLEHKIDLQANNELMELAQVINNVSDSLKRNIQKVSLESAQKQRMLSELELGNTIQLGMLPEEISSESIDLFAFMKPARFVGGDFYDYFYTENGKLAFIVADVAGKGVGAALFMSFVKGIIKLIAKHADSPCEVMKMVNAEIIERNENCTFITVALGFLDTQTYRLTYCIGGHFPPLLKRGNKVTHLSCVKSLPLGVKEDWDYIDLTFDLLENDALVLYTDGVSESASSSGEFFGEASIIDCIRDTTFMSSEELCLNIFSRCDSFSGDNEQFDDITLAVLRIRGPHYSRKIKNTIEQLHITMEDADRFLKQHQIKNAFYVLLALEELLTNIVKYGSSCTIEILLEIFEDSIKIMIVDNSFAFDPTKISNPDVSLPLEKRKIGGLGIYLIRKSAKSTSYQRVQDKNINIIIISKEESSHGNSKN